MPGDVFYNNHMSTKRQKTVILQRKAVLQVFCTFVIEKSIELLFGHNYSQFVTAVNDKYDGMAFSEEDKRSCN